jgi:hypothetical protein
MDQPGPGDSMTRQIPADPFEGWPPVISSAEVPRAVKLRDLMLTILMWLLLLLILAREIHVAWVAWEVARGRSDAALDLALAEFLEKLRPLMFLVSGLVVALAAATIVSRNRRDRAVSARQPDPLAEAVLAQRAGLSLHALEAARIHRVAIVHRTPAGGISVVPKAAATPQGTA